MKMIWKKYFFFELMKVFALFISCFYFIYVLIDYSVHSKVFQSAHVRFFEILVYYLYQFTKRADILIPVALLVSTIKVLTTSNLRNEIVVLATGGIALKRILRPFLCAALLCSAALYLNFEFLQPLSLNKITNFEEHYFKGRGMAREKKQVNALILKDDTLLIYQTYDPGKRAFFDVYWIKEDDHFTRIQWLFPYEKIPFGKYADSLMRTSEGEIVKLASSEEAVFPEMKFDTEVLFDAVHPPRMQSISQLARRHHFFTLSKMNDREAETATFLYFKLTIPLVCLLAVIGAAPFCLRFTRNLPVFLIYALSICCFVTFFTCVNSSVILGESQVIPPLLAILLPQSLFFLLLGWKYAKL